MRCVIMISEDRWNFGGLTFAFLGRFAFPKNDAFLAETV